MPGRIPWWWSLGAWALLAAVTVVCLAPRPPTSPLPSDKLDHLVAFAALAAALACGRRSPWAWAAAVALWGGAIELGQGLTGRHGDWLDWAADGLGAAIGLGLLWLPPLAALHRRWRPNRDGS
ncbi:MAG: hypothetical protein RLZZ127_2039 [Planctomycetota bacterium]|jgi:VanZ family protein